jgi:FKBP-type peptidyl-prolyl cis-trans isomerase FkpA
VTRNFLTLAVCALLVGAAACADGPTSPSSSAPFSQVDLRLGTGAEATAGKVLSVNYTGWLYDGSKTDLKGLQFDSSAGLTPLKFTLGSGGVIEGFDRGAGGMRVGGIRRIVIPPSLGYGSSRNASIPASATLLFEVELLEVADPVTAGR